MNSKFIIGIVLSVILIGITFAYSKNQKNNTDSPKPTPTIKKENFSFVLKNPQTNAESGIALIDYKDETVNVSVNLVGGESEVPYPVHIQSGSCDKPGNVKFSLNSALNGKSETRVNQNKDNFKDSILMVVDGSNNSYFACSSI